MEACETKTMLPHEPTILVQLAAAAAAPPNASHCSHMTSLYFFEALRTDIALSVMIRSAYPFIKNVRTLYLAAAASS